MSYQGGYVKVKEATPIVSEVIVVRACLCIIVLPRETEIVSDGIGGDVDFTERFVVCRPDNCAGSICHPLRCGEMIVVIVVCYPLFYHLTA